jgi:hypothetical protein
MEDVFHYADELGPSKSIHVYEPSVKMKAILVVDNVAKGPSIGGIRMTKDVSNQECFGLARAMAFKNAPAGLPDNRLPDLHDPWCNLWSFSARKAARVAPIDALRIE